MERTFLIAAALLGFLAVALGAFGAHSLETYFSDKPQRADNYHTATLYQMFHVVGLLAAAWAATQYDSAFVAWAGWLFVAGVLLFSGSLYILSLTGLRWLGAITPLGGLAMLGGWACLALAAWQQ